MCHHGETGFKRWALGRMAQKVARHSSVPVFLLREGDPEPLELHTDATHPLRALVALDGSSLAEAILIPAAHLVATLASPAQGALHLTRVVQLPTAHHDNERDVDLAKQAQAELDFVHFQLKTGGREKPLKHGTREQSSSRIAGGCWIALLFPDMQSHCCENIMEGGRGCAIPCGLLNDNVLMHSQVRSNERQQTVGTQQEWGRPLDCQI